MNGSASQGTGDSGEKLARVTYLPGVVPPAAEPFEPEQFVPPMPSRLDASPVRPRAKVIEELSQAIEEIESVSPESEGERSARAANVSMHALARRGMSSAEMTALLRSRDLTAGDVEDEVDRLERVGLLDDHELASNLVRTLHDRKGLGRSAITAELRRRRIDAVAIEEALNGLDGDDELARATEIATKRAPQLRNLDAETARRRLGAFLMRKGYSGSVVSSAVAAALNGTALKRNALSANLPTVRGPRFQ
ncbi:MAG TPA: regulatory protein RecX [Galbitalea sp.]